MTFAEFMERCLYDPQHGYYTTKEKVFGREGDFYTSGYTHPLFAQILAEAFGRYLGSFGERPVSLVELGAGEAVLGTQVLAALRMRNPDLAARLHYIPVEVNDPLPQRISGIVFSNEFFDALSVHRVRIREGSPVELYVEVGDEIRETEGPVSDSRIGDYLRAGFQDLQEGWDYEVNLKMIDWLATLDRAIARAYVVTIDYGFRPEEYGQLSRAAGTVMSYYRHQLVPNPYERPGEQDITAHVNFEVLAQTGRKLGWLSRPLKGQREFMMEFGLAERLAAIERDSRVLDAARVEELLQLKTLLVPGGISDTMKVLVQEVRV